jgi:hypothetical protein
VDGVVSAWILPSTRIEPEPSASQKKWSGRAAILPPGRRGAGSNVFSSGEEKSNVLTRIAH